MGCKMLLSTNDKTIKLWRDQTCEATLTGHTFGVMCLAVLPDGTRMTQAGAVRCWGAQ